MFDFTELPKDGRDFELLTREVLFSLGMRVSWSGMGQDGGKDLICIESIDSPIAKRQTRWLVQCKHNAHSGKSVSIGDLDGIVDSCSHHDADAYLLACSTWPSSKVVERLESIANNAGNHISTAYIGASDFERILSTANNYHIAQRFFPNSTKAKDWKVYHTDRPNHFIVNLRGYNFHLTNRIGSTYGFLLESVNNRIDDFKKIPFDEGHFIRPRCFWYDDKNGGFIVYLDYMLPRGAEPQYSSASIASSLGDGYALEDGQTYSFEVRRQFYVPTSDHYDRDHYDYYSPYLGSFLIGGNRPEEDREYTVTSYPLPIDPAIVNEGEVVKVGADAAFNKFEETLRENFGDGLVRAENAYPEVLAYYDRGALSPQGEAMGAGYIDPMTATFVFKGSCKAQVFEMLDRFDQGAEIMFSCSEGYTFLPKDGAGSERSFDDDGDRLIFLRMRAMFESEPSAIRDSFNSYFVRMRKRIAKT